MPLSELTIASFGTVLDRLGDVRLDLGFQRMSADLLIERRQTVIWINVQFAKHVFIFLKYVFEICLDDSPENDRVGDLHHRRFQVSGKENVLLFGFLDRLADKDLRADRSMTDESITSPAFSGERSFRTFDEPSSP